jgi:4-amino-4-deoxy-L-arabinose transferase-like glycosyltransferase
MKTVLVFALLFALLGLILIPYAGLEADELLFAASFHGPANEFFAIRLRHHSIPLMLLSYLGALKTFVYWPLFWIRTASVYAIRLPMVLAGAATIVLFYKWAGLFAGPRGALLAAVLLATDPTFLLTDTFDWGPVALQHLLVVSGCLLIARGRLTWGAFLFGLALWNKAIFGWTLAGLGLAALLVLPGAVRAVFADWPRLTRALLAFALGALPLLVFNVKHPNSTLGDNTHFSFENFPVKYQELKGAVDGSGLFGFLVAPDSEEYRREPESPQGRVASWISDHLGSREKNLMPYAILIAASIVLLWWRAPGRRAGLFAAVCAGSTFLAMAVTRDAGTSIHHTVLVWPMPQLLVGAAFGALPWRWLRVGLVTLLVSSNLLVVSQYIAQFERNGSNGSFTDATNPLADSLAPTSGENIHFIDWGIYEPVDFLLQGKSHLHESYSLLIQGTPDPGQRREIDAMILDPNALFVDHIPALEQFREVGVHLEAIARSERYEKIPIRTVADRNGRVIFQVFRFQQMSAGLPSPTTFGPGRPQHR